MSVIYLMILASLAIALLFLGSFIWAVTSGQFDDTHTPSMRILTDDAKDTKAASSSTTTPSPK